MAASLTLLGISFLDPVVRNPAHVVFIAHFSIFVFVIWIALAAHNQRWIDASYCRLHEIEEELRKLDFNVRLHTSMKKMGNGTGSVLTILLAMLC